MKKYFSQFRQDEFIDKVIFRNRFNGVFIDVGAHDGISFSNTFYFETNRKWKGICFEPNPEVFNKLEKNRLCQKVQCCIGQENSEVLFWQISGYSEMLSGIKGKFDNRHISRIDKELTNRGGELKEIIVPMRMLSSFDLFVNNRINYLSIDTEGGEFDILKSIDFIQYEIDTITVENNYNDEGISRFLKGFGYVRLCKLGCDEIYVHSRVLNFTLKFRFLIWKLNNKIRRIVNF